MLIRHVDADRDAAACAGIYAPHVSDSVTSLELVAPDRTEFARRIATIERTHPFLVAVDDRNAGEEAVAGFAYASPFHERAGYRWAATVSVYIDPRHHRRGIGRALYETLFELLRRQGLWSACSGITLPNDASVALHESCGFELVGVYTRIGWKAGNWRDVGWWQLALRAPGYDERDDERDHVGTSPPEPGPPVRIAGAGIVIPAGSRAPENRDHMPMSEHDEDMSRLRDEENRAENAIRREEHEMKAVERAMERELKAFEEDERRAASHIEEARHKEFYGHEPERDQD